MQFYVFIIIVIILLIAFTHCSSLLAALVVIIYNIIILAGGDKWRELDSISRMQLLLKLERCRGVAGQGWRRVWWSRALEGRRAMVVPPLESLLKTLSDQWGAGWWGVGFRAKLPSYLYNNVFVCVRVVVVLKTFFYFKPAALFLCLAVWNRLK